MCYNWSELDTFIRSIPTIKIESVPQITSYAFLFFVVVHIKKINI